MNTVSKHLYIYSCHIVIAVLIFKRIKQINSFIYIYYQTVWKAKDTSSSKIMTSAIFTSNILFTLNATNQTCFTFIFQNNENNLLEWKYNLKHLYVYVSNVKLVFTHSCVFEALWSWTCPVLWIWSDKNRGFM